MVGLPIPEQPLAENELPTAPASGRSLKGKSMVPLLLDPTTSVRVGALTLFKRDGAMGYAYRTEQFRYVEWVSTYNGNVMARELYDYWQDPMETINLAGEPGYDALMYQFSASMRTEMDQLKQNEDDLAAAGLQGSAVFNTATNSLALPGLRLAAAGTMDLTWPDGAGWSYDVMMKTNLIDVTWQLYQGGWPNNAIAIPLDKPTSFWRIYLSE